jgi:hypothetical protein
MQQIISNVALLARSVRTGGLRFSEPHVIYLRITRGILPTMSSKRPVEWMDRTN